MKLFVIVLILMFFIPTSSLAMAQGGGGLGIDTTTRTPTTTPTFSEIQEMSQEGKAVTQQAISLLQVIDGTIRNCTTHIYTQNWEKMDKCLNFMKNWNATLTTFTQDNSMTMIEITLGLVP